MARLMAFPSHLVGYGGVRLKVNPVVWGVLYAEAVENKQWAEDHEYRDNPDAWPASGISVEMLKERLTKSPLEMTEDSYRYFHHRAHLGTQHHAWDGPARQKWETLTGRPVTA